MKRVVAALALVMGLGACAPGLDPRNPVPDPNPDHGAQAPGPTKEPLTCAEPYLIIEIAILAGATDASRGYASRPIHITVTSMDAAGRPVIFTDDQGNETANIYTQDTVTPPGELPYRKCFEYQPLLEFADVGVVMIGQEWDWMRMEISRYDNPNFNLCVDPRFGTGLSDYAQVEIGEGQGNTAALNCIVPLVA